jgi:hypothetical protein
LGEVNADSNLFWAEFEIGIDEVFGSTLVAGICRKRPLRAGISEIFNEMYLLEAILRPIELMVRPARVNVVSLIPW